MKGDTPVAIERTDGTASVSSEETNQAQEGIGAAAAQISNAHAWYTYFNEDVFATLFGLLLVILLVVGWLHTIP